MKEANDLICQECGSDKIYNRRQLHTRKEVIKCGDCSKEYIYVDIETKYTKEATCPYCGHECSDSWEFPLEYDGDFTTTECDECGKEFKIYLNLETTYTSEKMEVE